MDVASLMRGYATNLIEKYEHGGRLQSSATAGLRSACAMRWRPDASTSAIRNARAMAADTPGSI